MQADTHTQSQVTKQRSLITLVNSLDYCTQEAVLSQRVAKCCLHNSVKLSLCSPELDLFCDILGEWT